MAGQDITSRFNALYDSLNRRVLAFITAKCGNLEDVRDIFQETWLEVYSMLAKRGADYARNDEALVMQIAKQKLFRHYSLPDRVKSVLSFSAAQEDGGDLELAEPAAMEDAVLDACLLEQVGRFLASKPMETQKIFTLFYSLELTIAEIADLLGCSESNIKNKIYRTRKEIRAKHDLKG